MHRSTDLDKILSGTLKETLYEFPDSHLIKNGAPSPPTVTKESIYQENQVTYVSDDLGVHRVMNPDPERMAVSLHRKQSLPQAINSLIFQY